eukprot:13040231-Alexandrium_andersonii.AAC.1
MPVRHSRVSQWPVEQPLPPPPPPGNPTPALRSGAGGARMRAHHAEGKNYPMNRNSGRIGKPPPC